MDKTFANLFGGAFGFGEKTGGFLSSGTVGATIATAAWVRLAPAAEGISSILGQSPGSNMFSGFNGLFDKVGQGFNSFLNLFGMGNTFAPNMNLLAGAFADGGIVSQYGTGAVPIVAHAGELILNEAQQARVASAMSNSSQQVVNLNITGDISRQTKSEIYKMLPSIAEGVNSHNREKGLR